MTNSAAYNTALERLNPQQRQAVEAIFGPVMVIAGPGTGKTQILTVRIAHILSTTDTDPSQILAITFTESGVASMRKRLKSFIGPRAHRIQINTFHGFAQGVLSEFPELFPRFQSGQPLSPGEQMTIIQNLIKSISGLDLLRPFGDPTLYTRAILSGITTLKQEGVDPERFDTLCKNAQINFENTEDLFHEKGAHKGKMKTIHQKTQKQINKNKELAKLYQAYQDHLTESQMYDFSDMVMALAQGIETHQDLKQELQERHQFVLVDEHQDTNNAQNRVIELLAPDDNPNLFVVGDEKQSIFKFQGANLENFFYFKHRFPDAQMITLTTNYRSTQPILDASHKLLPTKAALEAFRQPDEQTKIYTQSCSHPDAEHFAVAKSIQDLIEAGVSPSEIAILYRNNRDAFPIAEALERLAIPYVIESDTDILKEPVVQQLLTLLHAVISFGDDAALARSLYVPALNISMADAHKLIRVASKKRKFSLIDLVRDPGLVASTATLENPSSVANFGKKLTYWAEAARYQSATTVLATVMRESGLMAVDEVTGLNPDTIQHLGHIWNELQGLQSRSSRLTMGDFLEHLNTLEVNNLLIKGRQLVPTESVHLMTAHRSKGLEFQHVFIIGVNDGHFGNAKKRELLPLLPQVYSLFKNKVELDLDLHPAHTDSNAEERRLLYVAMTRAKFSATISWSETDAKGKDRLPSQFVDEISDKFLAPHPTMPAYLEQFQNNPLAAVTQVTPTGIDPLRVGHQYLWHLFTKTSLSVSALNNYIRSPWQYIFQSLLRLPKAPTKHQVYGIAVHSALQHLFDNLNYREVTIDEFINWFEDSLSNQAHLIPKEFDTTLAKGRETLASWYDAHQVSFFKNTLSEHRTHGVVFSEDVTLTGVFDKVELLGGNRVRVIDYKTGKPKSRNQILGETKDSEGNYFRQLVFYKLLLDLDPKNVYRMESGVIQFIEPDKNGNFRTEEFTITETDVAKLKQEIFDMTQDIKSGEFLTRACDPDTCDYCDLISWHTPTTMPLFPKES